MQHGILAQLIHVYLYTQVVFLYVATGTKEYDVFIDNYSKFSDILKPGFKNMIPYFITERMINPEESKFIQVEDVLAKIAMHLR